MFVLAIARPPRGVERRQRPILCWIWLCEATSTKTTSQLFWHMHGYVARVIQAGGSKIRLPTWTAHMIVMIYDPAEKCEMVQRYVRRDREEILLQGQTAIVSHKVLRA